MYWLFDCKGGPETAANNKHITVVWSLTEDSNSDMFIVCLQFQLSSANNKHITVMWYCWQFQGLKLCCPQSIPHDQWYGLLFAAVSGPPLLSSVNTTTVICLLFAAVSGPPLLSSANNITVMWYRVRTAVSGPETLQQTINLSLSCDMFIVCCSFRPSFAVLSQYHINSDMFIVCCSFKGGPETAANNKHITVMWYWLKTAKEGLKLQQTINISLSCGIDDKGGPETAANNKHITVMWYWVQQRRAWNCSKQ